jgi:predicted ArsR family transcriptional regulator
MNKTQVRKAVGRGKFTPDDLSQALSISRRAARGRLAKLVEAGAVVALDETAKVTDEDGKPQRGRPRKVYRVA